MWEYLFENHMHIYIYMSNKLVQPRLVGKLEACKAKLEESFQKFASHMTEFTMDEMQKLKKNDPKLTAFLGTGFVHPSLCLSVGPSL